MLAAASIQFKWAGALSVCTWTVEVVGHFFMVLFIILLLASQTAFKTMPGIEPWEYSMFMSVTVGTLLPACLIWSISGMVTTRRRVKLTEESGA